MSTKKKILIACAGVVVIGVIAFFSIRATRKNEVAVQSSKVQRKETLKSKVSASGEIRAKEFVDIQSEVAGVVTELPVREGDRVDEGPDLGRDGRGRVGQVVEDQEEHLAGEHPDAAGAGRGVVEVGEAVGQGVEVVAVPRGEPEGLGEGGVEGGGIGEPPGVDPDQHGGPVPVNGPS